MGVADDVWGEIAMAVVKLVPGSNATEEDLIKFLEKEGVDKGKITKWMLPRLVVIVDNIPKTSVGKYNKREIKANIENYRSKAKEVGRS